MTRARFTCVAIVTDAAKKTELHLLVQNGPVPTVWSWDGVAAAKPLDVASLFSPVAGTNLTAFDLQMPFLCIGRISITRASYRMRICRAHQFLLHPPKNFAEKYPILKGVRVFLDTEFNALVQVELVGNGGQTLKTTSLLELKRIGKQRIPIPKTFDVRDEVTRNKTRFVVKGATLGLKLPRDIFTVARLAGTVNPPETRRRIVPVE